MISHQLVDTLPDDASESVLACLRGVAAGSSDADHASATMRSDDEPVEFMRRGKPTSVDDPLWNIVGVIGEEDGAPSDMAEQHDRYLAEIHDRRHEV